MISQEEKSAVLRVLDSPQLVHGPVSTEFETSFSNFIGDGYSTSTTSATTALQLAYMVLGIGIGDEVIVTSLTHVATANAIRAVGAIPVFVDVNIGSGNISVDEIRKAINEKTKAICVVHYLGLPVDMNQIVHLARINRLHVVEDCALALGSFFGNEHVGLIGDFGAFSFYPAKHITTGEGGMLISRNKDSIDEAKKVKAFYYSRDVGERKVPGQYDIVGFGLNLRMSEIAAAIGCEQVKKLPFFLNKRRENADILTKGFKSNVGKFLSFESEKGISGLYCASFVFNSEFSDRRDKVALSLKNQGITTSIYYPVSLPQSNYYKSNPKLCRSFPTPNSDFFARSSIAIGIGPHLSTSDMEYVREGLEKILQAENK